MLGKLRILAAGLAVLPLLLLLNLLGLWGFSGCAKVELSAGSCSLRVDSGELIVAIPSNTTHWSMGLLAVGSAVLSILVLMPQVILPEIRERRRRSLIARKCCPYCGYDVRGCTERCSECGGPIHTQHAVDEDEP